MDPTREIGDAMRVAREMKEYLVRSQGVGTDLAHLLELRRDGVEAVGVHAQDRSGHTVLTQHPYRYEGRSVAWGEPLVLDSADDDAIVEGEIPKRMRRGFEAQATRPGRSLSGVELAYVLDLDAVSFELKAPPRNEPCPCGSGLKSKHCCWR